MCCGATYPANYSGSAGGGATAWAARSGGATDFYAVLPKGETTERVVASYAEAITATARGGGMRRITAAQAEQINAAAG